MIAPSWAEHKAGTARQKRRAKEVLGKCLDKGQSFLLLEIAERAWVFLVGKDDPDAKSIGLGIWRVNGKGRKMQ
jgi:hypothetical protein